MEGGHKDVLARSQSWAVIRHVERLGTERKGSVADEDHGDAVLAVPIQEAQSYKPDKTSEAAAVRRLMETLTEPAARHSAASLKVHFRCSLDDIGNDNDDDDDNNSSLNGGAVDCSYRSGTLPIIFICSSFVIYIFSSLIVTIARRAPLTRRANY